MIERYVNADVFTSKEEYLLVPAPIGETEFNEGFIGQVIARHPFVAYKLRNRGGVAEGEVVILKHDIDVLPYKLAIAGIHKRQQEGWKDTPELLQNALKPLEDFVTYAHVASAGIPGTGFSGLRGNADSEAIKGVMDSSSLRFHVYQNGLSGDRAEVLSADPDLEDHARLTEV